METIPGDKPAPSSRSSRLAAGLIRLAERLLFLCVCAWLALPLLIGSGWVRGELAGYLAEHFGRQVAVGQIHPHWFNPLHWYVADIEIRDEEGKGVWVRAPWAEVSVALGPLLARDVRIERVVLAGAHMELRTGPKGIEWPGWKLEEPAGEAEDLREQQGAPWGWSLPSVRLVRGTVHWNDLRHGRLATLEKINAEVAIGPEGLHLTYLEGDSGESSLRVRGSVDWSGRAPLSFEGELTALLHPGVLLGRPELSGSIPLVAGINGRARDFQLHGRLDLAVLTLRKEGLELAGGAGDETFFRVRLRDGTHLGLEEFGLRFGPLGLYGQGEWRPAAEKRTRVLELAWDGNFDLEDLQRQAPGLFPQGWRLMGGLSAAGSLRTQKGRTEVLLSADAETLGIESPYLLKAPGRGSGRLELAGELSEDRLDLKRLDFSSALLQSSASGSLDDLFTSRFSYQIRGESVVDLARLKGVLPPRIRRDLSAAGDVPFQWSLSGTGWRPRMALRADLGELSLASAGWQVSPTAQSRTLDGELSLLEGWKIEIGRLVGRWGTAEARVEGLYDLARQRGWLLASGSFHPQSLRNIFREPLLPGLEVGETALFRVELSGDQQRLGYFGRVDLSRTRMRGPWVIDKPAGAPAHLELEGEVLEGERVLLTRGQAVLENLRLLVSGEFPLGGSGPFTLEAEVPRFNLVNLRSVKGPGSEGRATGTLGARISLQGPLERPSAWKAQGELKGSGISLGLHRLDVPLRDLDLDATFTLDEVQVSKASFTLGETVFEGQGGVRDFAAPAVWGRLRATTVDLDRLKVLLAANEKEQSLKDEGERGLTAFRWFPLSADLTVDRLLYHGQTIEGLRCQVRTVGDEWIAPLEFSMGTGRIRSTVRLARPQGEILPFGLAFDIQGMRVEKFQRLLTGAEGNLKGALTLTGELEGRYPLASAGWGAQSLTGKLHVEMHDGEVRGVALLRNIALLMRFPVGPSFIPLLQQFMLANQVLEVVRSQGRALNITVFPYRTLSGNFQFGEGRMTTIDTLFDSDVMFLAAAGSVGLADGALELDVASHPFSSVSTLVGKIPWAGARLKQGVEVVSVYHFNVRGVVGDPKVTPASYDALKEQTRKAFERLFRQDAVPAAPAPPEEEGGS